MKKENKKEITISVKESYVKGGIMSSLICLPFVILFYLLNQDRIHDIILIFNSKLSYSSILIIIIFGTIFHEFLHGISWAIFGKKSFKNIQFGIILKTLTPFCHFKVPLTKNAYAIGTLMPFILLGFLPLVIGLLSSSLYVLFWGILFTFAASGDLICYWNIRKLDSKLIILDHPKKIGCIIQ